MCVSSAVVIVHFLVVHPWSTLAQPAPVLWLSLLNATLCTVLPVFATMLAIERIGAGRASMAAMIGPVATIALAFVILGEPVSGWQVVGTAFVLAGVYVLTLPPSAVAHPTRKEA
jgi:drug/metabolite transporter (DMT)-like permease